MILIIKINKPFIFWDPLASSAMYNPICTYKKLQIDVVTKVVSTSGLKQIKKFGSSFLKAPGQFRQHLKNRDAYDQIESGRTIPVSPQKTGFLHDVCVNVDVKSFKKDFIDTINKAPMN